MANFVTDGIYVLKLTKLVVRMYRFLPISRSQVRNIRTTNQAALDIRSFINLEVILQSYGADASGALDCSSALAAALAVIGASSGKTSSISWSLSPFIQSDHPC